MTEETVVVRKWPPPWFTVFAVGALAMSTILALFAWWEIDRRHDDRVHRCEQAVVLRDDHRSMWTALFEEFPQQAVDTGLQVELEIRLPPLRCDGYQLVPRGAIPSLAP